MKIGGLTAIYQNYGAIQRNSFGLHANLRRSGWYAGSDHRQPQN